MKGGAGAPSDMEVWGFARQNYGFPDLKHYLKKPEQVVEPEL